MCRRLTASQIEFFKMVDEKVASVSVLHIFFVCDFEPLNRELIIELHCSSRDVIIALLDDARCCLSVFVGKRL